MLAALTLAALAATPDAGRYVLSLSGVPAGVVSFRVEKGRYVYESEWLFRGEEQRRTVRLAVDAKGRTPAGRVPEVLWLARLRGKGCAKTLEELHQRDSEVCVDAVDGGRATGRIGEEPFSAEYDAQGRLSALTVAQARFVASAAPMPRGGDPFGAGFRVQGDAGAPGLVPPAPGVRVLAAPPAGGLVEGGEDGSCLALARAAAAADAGLDVVVGLVLEDGRAWPHAWVERRTTRRAVDPSVRPKDPLLARRAYVAFPTADAGRLYLELLAGARQVVRSP